MKASSIMALDWLGTKTLYNLGVDGLSIKSSSTLALDWLDLTTEALFILGFGGLRKKKSSTIMALDWVGTKALCNLGVDGLRIKLKSFLSCGA